MSTPHAPAAVALRRICVAGAGAIGGTLAARLAAAGHDVTVYARGETLAAIASRGLSLEDLSGTLHTPVRATDRADFGIQDVIFVCAKTHALPALLKQLLPLIGPDTIVIPTVNGVPWWYFQGESGRFEGEAVQAVDPGGALLALLPARQLLGCVVYITAEVLQAGSIRATNPHLMLLGELDNLPSARLHAVCALLSGSGIEARASSRIRDDVWSKIVGNLTSNPLSVVTGATLEEIYGLTELREVVLTMLREATLVAATYGARLSLDPDSFLARGATMGAFRTSMLQDHEKGRPLELAAIGDAVLELAARYDIPMPSTRVILALTRFCTLQRARAAAASGQAAPRG